MTDDEAGDRHQAHGTAAARPPRALDRDRGGARRAGGAVLHRDAGEGAGRAGSGRCERRQCRDARCSTRQTPRQAAAPRSVSSRSAAAASSRSMVGCRLPRCRSIPGSAAPPASAARRRWPRRRRRQVSDRTITVRFDSNVAAGLPWRFEPEQPHHRRQARRGRHRLLYRHQRGRPRRPPARPATMSAPSTVGIYFEKINCFCFTEQTMKPGEKRDMAVVFYVDPKLAEDSEQDDAQTHHALLHLLSGARCRIRPAAESAAPGEVRRI